MQAEIDELKKEIAAFKQLRLTVNSTYIAVTIPGNQTERIIRPIIEGHLVSSGGSYTIVCKN